jgi:putative ubiquitin-RnfH superfamily antitoxin RatB of RatAB toxin-antitoxin module
MRDWGRYLKAALRQGTGARTLISVSGIIEYFRNVMLLQHFFSIFREQSKVNAKIYDGHEFVYSFISF